MVEIAPPVSQPAASSEPVSDVGQMSQWKLMTLRFARNKLAMLGL